MRGPKLPYRYDHHTWVELKEIIPRQPVVVRETRRTRRKEQREELASKLESVSATLKGTAAAAEGASRRRLPRWPYWRWQTLSLCSF